MTDTDSFCRTDSRVSWLTSAHKVLMAVIVSSMCLPSSLWCPVSQRANARRAQKRNLGGDKLFGEAGCGHSVSMDHLIAAAEGKSLGVGKNGERVAVCFKDLGTGYVDRIPGNDKTVTTT